MKVPYTRMNETLRLVHRLGGKITEVAVSGPDDAGVTQPAGPRTKRGGDNE
jgi:phycocyanin-associated rod protein